MSAKPAAAQQIRLAKAAILKGVDAAMFVEEMKVWTERRRILLAEQDAAQATSTESELQHPDLGRVYREKVGQLTAALQDEALKAQAFERLPDYLNPGRIIFWIFFAAIAWSLLRARGRTARGRTARSTCAPRLPRNSRRI